MSKLETLIPPPIVAMLCALLMWLLAGAGLAVELPDQLRKLLIVALLASTAYYELCALWLFRAASTTINPMRPQASEALVTDGIYRRTRNPMYLGTLFALCAWGVYLSTLAVWIGPVLFVVYITRFQIKPEERALRAQFGRAFKDYCRCVRRWV